MASLHVINQSPRKSEIWSKLLELSGHGDSLLLIENAIYALESSGLKDTLIRIAIERELQVLILLDDARSRGITDTVPWKSINYEEFVQLSTEHAKVISWSTE